ncbi:PucR family transcriptional regulator [Streptomyces sp. NRRL S-87]|uniref:PucR family transcriptional regulator n=1 Tax=Streptomyces sp. NRRL S-87 TaxID=1463920 RepID=UPI001F40A3D2|nr:PucR family transcriptional regulator [Streptomyces sp. NRRL S-87]
MRLEGLLDDAALGLRQAAGGTRAEVYGVHASEMADPSPYLLGGELLLTAGQELGPDPEAYAAYVARLVTAGVAALGFGLAPVHEAVPEALVRACAEQGLPLMEVPPGTPFTAVARAVWRLMAEARTRELRRVTEAQQALAAAAARPDPVPAVLRRLAVTLGGWVGVLPTGQAPATGAPAPRPLRLGPAADPLRAVAAERAAGPSPSEDVLLALGELAHRVGAGGPATATATVGTEHLAAYALGRDPVLALALATPARTPGDHTIAGVAAVLLTLLTAHRAPGGGEAAALVRLLLGGSPGDALGGGRRIVVHARGAGDPAALAAGLGTALYEAEGPYVRLLLPAEHAPAPGPQPGWRMGVSAPADPDGLTVADAQAARALERAESARAPLAHHAEAGFGGLVGAAEARAHAEALLGPLNPVQRATLRSWLAHHGSWDRTAVALDVHRNTVRQRISRAAVLLGLDLDDPDVRMELWFALRSWEERGRG